MLPSARQSGAFARPRGSVTQARGRSDGFTALEVIIVVALIGVILGFGVVQLRPPATRVYANDLKAQIQQAKFEAVKRNAPVAVVWNSVDEEFETRVGGSVGSPCGATVIATRRPGDYGALAVSTTMSPGVAWLPNGQGVTCANGPNISSVTTIDDGRTTRTVAVHLGGGVEIQ